MIFDTLKKPFQLKTSACVLVGYGQLVKYQWKYDLEPLSVSIPWHLVLCPWYVMLWPAGKSINEEQVEEALDKVKASLKTLKEFKNQFQVDFGQNSLPHFRVYPRSTKPSVPHTSKRMMTRTKDRRTRTRRRTRRGRSTRTRTRTRRRRRTKRSGKCASHGTSRNSSSSSVLTALSRDLRPSRISATPPTSFWSLKRSTYWSVLVDSLSSGGNWWNSRQSAHPGRSEDPRDFPRDLRSFRK